MSKDEKDYPESLRLIVDRAGQESLVAYPKSADDYRAWMLYYKHQFEEMAGKLTLYQDFRPDALHVNALPEKLKQYVHDLETDADPAGDKARLLLLKEQVDGLSSLYAQAKAELHAMHTMIDDIAWDTIENDGTFVTVRVKALDSLLATRRKP